MPSFWLQFSARLQAVAARYLLNWQTMRRVALTLLLGLVCVVSLSTPAAWAGLEDDRYDGDIFALYAGNGSLVPPRVTLEQAFKRDRPSLLVLYVDDSVDCKQYAPAISQVQEFYGRVVDILPIRVDSLPVKPNYTTTEPGYYYKGFVPQTVLFDASGKVVLNEAGAIPFETLDDKLREVFDLLPRSESLQLKRRTPA